MTDRLPTPDEMLAEAERTMDQAFRTLHEARNLFSEVRDILNSDWPPGTELTERQAMVRTQMRATVRHAHSDIDELKRMGDR